MRRRGNVLSPIDSVNTLVEMLVQTDSSVEDGEIVWVRNVQCLWVYRLNSGLVPDGANVLGSLYGGGVWVRLNSSPTIMGQATWFVDPTNGNDANDGKTLPTALKTDGERQRRWGPLAVLVQATTVTYTGSPTDQVNYNAQIGIGASLLIQGARTQTKAGTFQSVTVLNRGTQTPWSVTDSVGALGSVDVGRIIRITDGVRAGNNARVVKNNGGSNVRTTPFGKLAYNFIPFVQTAPQAGDPYEVVTLPALQIGACIFTQASNVGTTGATSVNSVQFDSLTLDGGASLLGSVLSNNIQIFYSQCILLHVGLGGPFGGHLIAGGGLDGSFFDAGPFVTAMSFGALHRLAGLQVFQGCGATLDGDCLFQDCELVVLGSVRGGMVSFFDRALTDSALIVDEDGTYISTIQLTGADLVWGTGNAGHGARAKSAGKIVYMTKPTVNGGLGAGREALVGGTDKVWGAIPYVEPANNAMIVGSA